MKTVHYCLHVMLGMAHPQGATGINLNPLYSAIPSLDQAWSSTILASNANGDGEQRGVSGVVFLPLTVVFARRLRRTIILWRIPVLTESFEWLFVPKAGIELIEQGHRAIKIVLNPPDYKL